MYAYNPGVENRAGEIYGGLQLQGAQALAGGINQAAQGIAGGIDQWNQLQQKMQGAQGTMQVAHGLGLINQEDLDMFNKLNPYQQVGAATSIAPLIQAHNMGMYYQGRVQNAADRNDIMQQNADTRSETTGLLPN